MVGCALMGFQPSAADAGFSVEEEEEGMNRYTIVSYVDDRLMFACRSAELVGRVKAQMGSMFEIRDLGEWFLVSWFLSWIRRGPLVLRSNATGQCALCTCHTSEIIRRLKVPGRRAGSFAA